MDIKIDSDSGNLFSEKFYFDEDVYKLFFAKTNPVAILVMLKTRFFQDKQYRCTGAWDLWVNGLRDL